MTILDQTGIIVLSVLSLVVTALLLQLLAKQIPDYKQTRWLNDTIQLLPLAGVLTGLTIGYFVSGIDLALVFNTHPLTMGILLVCAKLLFADLFNGVVSLLSGEYKASDYVRVFDTSVSGTIVNVTTRGIGLRTSGGGYSPLTYGYLKSHAVEINKCVPVSETEDIFKMN